MYGVIPTLSLWVCITLYHPSILTSMCISVHSGCMSNPHTVCLSVGCVSLSVSPFYLDIHVLFQYIVDVWVIPTLSLWVCITVCITLLSWHPCVFQYIVDVWVIPTVSLWVCITLYHPSILTSMCFSVHSGCMSNPLTVSPHPVSVGVYHCLYHPSILTSMCISVHSGCMSNPHPVSVGVYHCLYHPSILTSMCFSVHSGCMSNPHPVSVGVYHCLYHPSILTSMCFSVHSGCINEGKSIDAEQPSVPGSVSTPLPSSNSITTFMWQ